MSEKQARAAPGRQPKTPPTGDRAASQGQAAVTKDSAGATPAPTKLASPAAAKTPATVSGAAPATPPAPQGSPQPWPAPPYAPPAPPGWGAPAERMPVRPPRQPGLALPLWLFAFVMLLGLYELVLLYDEGATAAESTLPRDLVIEDDMVFFMLEDVDDDTANMTIFISITNYGEADSGSIQVDVYAKNKANDILDGRANTTAPAIGGERTVEVTLPISLPVNKTYRIQIYLLEANLLVLSGEGEVSLSDIAQSAKDFTSEDDGRGAADGAEMALADDDSAVPGFGVLVAAATLLGATLYGRRRRAEP